jgi:uncharacterized protein
MDALALLRTHEAEIRERFGIARIGVFGSVIRGEERPDSDVDILGESGRAKRRSAITWT